MGWDGAGITNMTRRIKSVEVNLFSFSPADSCPTPRVLIFLEKIVKR